MKIKILVGILVFLILVNLATIGTYIFLQFDRKEAPVQTPEFVKGHFPPPHLRLDRDQRKQMRSLFKDFRKETESIHEKLQQNEFELFSILQQETVPIGKADSLQKEINSLRYEVSRIAIRKLIEAKQFLSPEQQQHFFNALLGNRPGMPGEKPPFPPDKIRRKGKHHYPPEDF